MEEKRPGQHPDADAQPDDPRQNRTARPGGRAEGGLDPTTRDRELLRDAEALGKREAETLKEGGFGDHKGVDGFPQVPRTD